MPTKRPRNLSLKLSDAEIAQVHALADANDESVGRLVRRWIAREYERNFGHAPAPKPKLRTGRPKARRPARDHA